MPIAHNGAMGIEIERKFLVSSDGWRAAAHRVIPMAQGYINDMGRLTAAPRTPRCGCASKATTPR